MTKEDYTTQRDNLLAQAESALKAGNSDKSNEIVAQVTELDAKHEAEITAQANLNALKDTQPAVIEPTAVSGALTAVTTTDATKPAKATYETAFAKFTMGKPLSAEEGQVLDNVNRATNANYTHETTNTPTLIPNTTVAGIWKLVEEQYPLFADSRKFNVKGTLAINKHTGIVAGDAQWVDEGTPADDEQNAFDQLILKGFELNKVATVSWKMKAMSEAEFLTFLQQELADRVGVALGVAISQGTGTKQPKGVIPLLTEEADTPQVITYADQVSYKDLTAAMAKIHSTLAGGAAVYANNATIWNQLANLVDDNGRPLFVPDTNNGGVGNIFGRVIKADAGLADGQILIGNAADSLVVNTNEGMSVAMEDHVKPRETDYGAYAVVDFGLLTTKAFALLTAAPKA